MTEKEKMLAGEVYSATDPQLLCELNAVKDIIHEYNLLRPSETTRRLEILKGLLGHTGDDKVFINQPFYCDYGSHIHCTYIKTYNNVVFCQFQLHRAR